jgi:hypothetical protein
MLMIKKFEGEKMIFLKITSPRAKEILSAKNSSPRVFFLLSAKNTFTESFFLRRELFFYSRRRALRRELKVWLSPKSIPLGEDSVSVVIEQLSEVISNSKNTITLTAIEGR